jgi:hypothetical protein
VGFFYGCATLNTATLSDGAVTVKATLPLGPSHSIRAIYYGDMNYSASNSTATQEVKTLKYK